MKEKKISNSYYNERIIKKTHPELPIEVHYESIRHQLQMQSIAS